MPFLASVSFTSTDASSSGFTPSTHPSHIVHAPGGAETISNFHLVDLHEDITLSLGFCALFTPHQDTAVAGTVANSAISLPQLIRGNDPSTNSISIACIDYLSNTNLTDESNISHMVILPIAQVKHSVTML